MAVLLVPWMALTHWPLGDLNKALWVIDGWDVAFEIAVRWISLDLTDDKSTLVQVMAWCHQATSHYLSQCWLRSMSPYGITRLNKLIQASFRYCIYCECFCVWVQPLRDVTSFLIGRRAHTQNDPCMYHSYIVILVLKILNTLRLRHNGRHFPDDIFKCIFLPENVWIPITISLKFVPKSPINNIPALV